MKAIGRIVMIKIFVSNVQQYAQHAQILKHVLLVNRIILSISFYQSNITYIIMYVKLNVQKLITKRKENVMNVRLK